MSGISLHRTFPPGGCWRDGEEQRHKWQRGDTRLPNGSYQCCSLLAGNKKVPEKMIHAAWKETVSCAGKDLSNTPYAIIRLSTAGSWETIINNTYLNCFHALCPGGPAPSTRPHPISSHDKWVMRVPLLLQDHTPGWAFQTHPRPRLGCAAPHTVLHPASSSFLLHLLGPSFYSPSSVVRSTLCSSSRLISGAVMDSSVVSFFCTCSPPTPNQRLLLAGLLDQV